MASAQAGTFSITIENLQGAGGFSLTPLYTMFHDGSFDPFTEGQSASAAVEALAEVGVTSLLPDGPTTRVVVDTGGGPPTIDPGQSVTSTITFDPAATSARFFSFLSMIVPTNDQFIGNDQADAFEVFDAGGNFLGPLSINVTGLFAYDAGTEVNNPADGPAFVLGVDGSQGTEEGGVITQAQFGLDPFVGLNTPAGVVGFAPDLVIDPGNTLLARITVNQVPLPATAPLMIGALAAFAFARRRRAAA